MTDNQLAKPQERSIDTIKNFLLSPDVKSRFEEMMGKGTSYYLNQVMLVVANSTKLQMCTPRSIFTAAMRAATLRLSVDPVQGQAWIIPYKDVATFQIGYKGVYELAQRTNLYRFINVAPVYVTEDISENRLTGIHGIVRREEELHPDTRVIVERKTGKTVWAYMLYFKLTNGFEKTFVMTVEEIERHAKTYAAKAYNDPDSAWNHHDGREREKMMMKTVLMNGLRQWGRFNPGDLETINEIEESQGWVNNSDAASGFGADPEPAKSPTATPEQIAAAWPTDANMSYETAASVKNRDGDLYISFSVEELETIYQALDAAIKANGMPPDVKASMEMKRDCALLIQNAIVKANTK